jgi:hypothetical protein
MDTAYIRLSPRRIATLRRDPARLRRVIGGELKVGKRVDIGDAWDGLHFLLSARRRAGAIRDTGDPFGLGLFGGRPLNPQTLEAESIVRFVDAAGVTLVDAELRTVEGGALFRRYVPIAMDSAAVYPERWGERGEAGFEPLLDAFLQWRELYRRAAEEAQAVICLLRKATP